MKKRSTGEDTLGASVMIIASITGVGFSSGQEVYQFFIRFGWRSFISVLLYPLLIGLFSYAFLYVQKKNNTETYESIIVSFNCKPVKKMVDLVITFFISTIVISMIAATGTIVRQLFWVPTYVGSIVCTVVLIVAVLVKNISLVAGFMRIVVPIFVISICLVCIASFFLPSHVAAAPSVHPFSLWDNWLVYGMIYISYNMLIIFGVLSSLKNRMKSNRQIGFSSVFPPLVLSILILLQFLAMIRQTAIEGIGVLPMAQVGKMISPAISCFYLVSLLLAACCAAISCFFSTFCRVVRIKGLAHIRHWVVAVALTAAFFVASRVGFVNIVSYVFPLIGFLGCFIMAFLVISFFSTRKKDRKRKEGKPAGKIEQAE